MEMIRGAIDDSADLSYRKDFVDITKSMGLEEPKMALARSIVKDKTTCSHPADKKSNLLLLSER